MDKTIKLIIDEIVNNSRTDKSLLSLSLAGSFTSPDKKLESSNDLDFVFIYEELTPKILDNIKHLAANIKKKYSSDKINIDHTLRIGPIKMPLEKPQNILIHFLVYSRDAYFKYESVLTRYSFQHYPPLLGWPLKEINNFKEVIDLDLFNEIDGIPAMKYWIKKKKVHYVEPTKEGYKITESKLENEAYLEVIFYSVLWLANNMLRTFDSYHPNIDKAMCDDFNIKIPIKSHEFPLKAYNYKNKLRKKEAISDKETEEIRIGSLKFITECESYLRMLQTK